MFPKQTRYIALLVALLLFTAIPANIVAAADTVTMVFTADSDQYLVDGTPLNLDAAPFMYDGRMLLPVRYVLQPLTGSTDLTGIATFDNSYQTAKKITDKKGTTVYYGCIDIDWNGHSITMWIGYNKAIVDNKEVSIDPRNKNITPMATNGRTMVPLLFVANSLGCDTKWDANLKQATIIYPPAQ